MHFFEFGSSTKVHDFSRPGKSFFFHFSDLHYFPEAGNPADSQVKVFEWCRTAARSKTSSQTQMVSNAQNWIVYKDLKPGDLKNDIPDPTQRS